MEPRRVFTIEELERMTPEERAEAVGAGKVLSLDDLPEAFRQRVIEKAKHLSGQRTEGSTE